MDQVVAIMHLKLTINLAMGIATLLYKFGEVEAGDKIFKDLQALNEVLKAKGL